MVEFKSGDFRPYNTSTVLYGTVLYCTLRYFYLDRTVRYCTLSFRRGDSNHEPINLRYDENTSTVWNSPGFWFEPYPSCGIWPEFVSRGILEPRFSQGSAEFEEFRFERAVVLYLAREVLSNLDSVRKGLFKFGSSEQWPKSVVLIPQNHRVWMLGSYRTVRYRYSSPYTYWN